MASMTPEASAQIRALLADSLTVWRIRGEVAPGEAAAVAIVRAEDDTVVWVEPAPESESLIP